jgi:hypothetical protein
VTTRLRTGAGLAAVVLVAMAVGRVITDTMPVNDLASQPFVRTSEVGRSVALRYADVEVTGVRAGPHLYGAEPIAAAGQFLLVDLRIVARAESTRLLGFALLDRAGRRYAPMGRGATCPTNTTAPAGVPWYAVFCFDVPKSRLAGMVLEVSKGDHGVDGTGQARDDLARISLGVDAARAKELAASRTAWRGQFPGLDPMDRTPVKEQPGQEAP